MTADQTSLLSFQPVLPTVSDSGALVVGYERPEQPLDLITEASNNLGLALGKGIHLAVNCAAHNLMDYVCKQNVKTCSVALHNEYNSMYSFCFCSSTAKRKV